MKAPRSLDWRVALTAAAFAAVSVPGIAWAQTSGGGQAPGVVQRTAPIQLPRTGNPDADTSMNPTLPFAVVGAGALLAGLGVWKRRQTQAQKQR